MPFLRESCARAHRPIDAHRAKTVGSVGLDPRHRRRPRAVRLDAPARDGTSPGNDDVAVCNIRDARILRRKYKRFFKTMHARCKMHDGWLRHSPRRIPCRHDGCIGPLASQTRLRPKRNGRRHPFNHLRRDKFIARIRIVMHVNPIRAPLKWIHQREKIVLGNVAHGARGAACRIVELGDLPRLCRVPGVERS